MTVSLDQLLSTSSKRFSPTGEATIQPPLELEPAEISQTPVAEEAPIEEIDNKSEVTLDQLLSIRRSGAQTAQPDVAPEAEPTTEPPEAAITPMERFKRNKAEIEALQEKQNDKLRTFAINKFMIGMRQFSLKFADDFSKNIDTFTTDPVASGLNFMVNNGLMGLVTDEEKELFQGGGINLITREGYKAAGDPIPDDLPDNVWTAAASEVAATGNLLSVARRGATLAITNPDKIVGKLGKAQEGLQKLGRLGRGTNKVLSAGQATGRFAKKTVKEFGEGMKARPGLTTAAELSGAVASGIAGAKFAEDNPDSPVTKFLVQATAGSAATLTVVRYSYEAMTAVKDLTMSAFSGPRAQQGLIRRIDEGVEDNKEELIGKLETKDGALIQEELPELRGVSTPTQQTGSPLLARIFQAIVDQSSKLQHAQQLQLEQYNEALQKAARHIGGDPSYTRQSLKAQQEELKRALAILLKNAQTLTRNKVKIFLDDGVELSMDEASALAQDSLDGILKVARGQESDLYKAIPERVQFLLDTPHLELQQLLKRRGKSSKPGDLPSYITKAFGSWRQLTKEEILALKKKNLPIPKGKRVWEVGNLGKKTNSIELTELRSRMLEDAKIAAAAGRKNKARILNRMAESIRHSFSQTPTNASKEAAHKIALANQFSNDLNSTFFNGKIAPLLAKSRRGGSKIDPEDFLGAAIGKKAGRKRAAMIKALHDEPAKFAKPGKLRAALENWIKSEFREKFVKDGQLVDPEGAARYMDEQRETLEMFPKIGDDLQSVVDSGDAAGVLFTRMEDLGKRLDNPKISRATMFIAQPPKDTFDKIRLIQETRDDGVGKAVDEFVAEINTDESGDALLGLQSAFFQYIMDISSSGKSTLTNLGFFTDGSKMTHLINEPAMKVMAFKILNKEQLKTLELIREAAVRLDTSIKGLPAKEGVLGAEGGPANLLRTFVKIAGARTGSEISHLTGRGNVQTPGLVSSAFERFLRDKIKDPIAILINKAFMDDDPTILIALLKGMKSEEEMRKASLKIGAWFAGTVYNSGNEYNPKDE